MRGLVSSKTLLEQLPFISDADAEIERVEAENERLTGLYTFNTGEIEDGTVSA